MPSVFDVAAYILEKTGPMTPMKLQKLVYYAQAWSLVWDEQPLFAEPIQAWASGPVVPELFNRLKGLYQVSRDDIGEGTPDRLTPEQQDSINRVLEFYGDKNPQWLSDLTHMEAPWVQARQGIPVGERGNKVIPYDALAEYYGSL